MTTDPLGNKVGKRAELRRKRRATRRKLTAAALAGLVVLLAVVTVVLVANGGDSGPTKDADTRTQRTVLLQVLDAGGAAASSALLAHDGKTDKGSVVLVPPQVLATVPGLGDLPFGQAIKTGSVEGSRNALSDLLGVTIDGSWVLDQTSFTRLVDQLGGISVTVDTTVLSGRTVLLTPGTQKLTGARALAFSRYVAAGEQEQTRLARLQSVLDGLVTALPVDPAKVLSLLGSGSRPSVGVPALTTLLKGLQADDEASELQYRSLPVVPIDVGTAGTRFRVDADGVVALVDELLADSIPPGARQEGNRVLVLNGVGTPGLGQKVRAKLVPAGFTFVGSRNADRFGYPTSQVLVGESTPDAAALGARVAKALGLPAGSVRTSRALGTVADVVVLVGKDFRAN